MIYVSTYPETIWEKIKFQFRKIVPTVPCSEIRQGPGVVECIQSEDTCITIPMSRVMQIVWESGYKNSLERAKKEYFDGLAQSMGGMVGVPCDEDDDDCDCASGPYKPSSTTVDGYS